MIGLIRKLYNTGLFLAVTLLAFISTSGVCRAEGVSVQDKELLGYWRYVSSAPGKSRVRGILEIFADGKNNVLLLDADYCDDYPIKPFKQFSLFSIKNGSISTTPRRGPLKEGVQLDKYYVIIGNHLYFSDKPMSEEEEPVAWSYKLLKTRRPSFVRGLESAEEALVYRQTTAAEIAASNLEPGLYLVKGYLAGKSPCPGVPPGARPVSPCAGAMFISDKKNEEGEGKDSEDRWQNRISVPLNNYLETGKPYNFYLTLYKGYQSATKSSWYNPLAGFRVSINEAIKQEEK